MVVVGVGNDCGNVTNSNSFIDGVDGEGGAEDFVAVALLMLLARCKQALRSICTLAA